LKIRSAAVGVFPKEREGNVSLQKERRRKHKVSRLGWPASSINAAQVLGLGDRGVAKQGSERIGAAKNSDRNHAHGADCENHTVADRKTAQISQERGLIGDHSPSVNWRGSNQGVVSLTNSAPRRPEEEPSPQEKNRCETVRGTTREVEEETANRPTATPSQGGANKWKRSDRS